MIKLLVELFSLSDSLWASFQTINYGGKQSTPSCVPNASLLGITRIEKRDILLSIISNAVVRILIKLHLSHIASQFHKASSSIIVNTYSYLVKNMYMYISHTYFYIPQLSVSTSSGRCHKGCRHFVVLRYRKRIAYCHDSLQSICVAGTQVCISWMQLHYIQQIQ